MQLSLLKLFQIVDYDLCNSSFIYEKNTRKDHNVI